MHGELIVGSFLRHGLLVRSLETDIVRADSRLENTPATPAFLGVRPLLVVRAIFPSH